MAKKKVRCVDCGFLCWLPPEHLRKYALKSEADFYLECAPRYREAVIQKTYTNLQLLACRRFQWSIDFPEKLAVPEIFNLIENERECLYFIPYQSGYTPDEHRELQRERVNQRNLIRATFLGIAAGASAAIVAQVISAQLSS